MSGASWHSLNELFHAAVEHSGDARRDFVAVACAGNVQLLEDVSRLLRAHDAAIGFMSNPAADEAFQAAEEPEPAVAGTVVGPYLIVREIGRGGMGAVYLAHRTDGQFQKHVAVKLIKRGMDTAAVLGRFRHERQILADLEHPNIARLLDAGTTGDGRPYFLMEYVDGRPIDRHCDEQRLTIEQRLQIFLDVCAGLSYAHQRLVVHRDIKPSNILVTPDGAPKLLDFGIAKVMHASSTGETLATAGMLRPMTPEYASPEQVRGLPPTTLGDVYSLGVLLYELLVGTPPLRFATRTPEEIARVITTVDPRRPSDALPRQRTTGGLDVGRIASEAISAARATTVGRLRSRLRGDLDTIVLMALHKDLERRYQSVEQLAGDIRRHLNGLPILARQDAALYRAVKFVRRHWRPLAAAAAVFVALGTGIAVAVWQADRAEREAARATATRDFLLSVFKASDPRVASDRPRGQITAKELLDRNAAKIPQTFAADPDMQIELLGVTADIYRELGEPERRAALRQQQVTLARAVYGDLHPAVVEGLLDQAREANGRQDDAAALKVLDEADGLIRRAGRDRSADRARWWLSRALALDSDPKVQSEHEAALGKAVQLFSEVSPSHPDYVTALSDMGHLYNNRQEVAAAIPFFRQAIAVAEAQPERNDAFLVNTHGNLGVALQCMRDFDGAEAEYAAAIELSRRTGRETGQAYWIVVTRRARMAHLLGDRARAYTLFEPMLRALPPETTSAGGVAWVREFYAGRLAAEGRPDLAIPVLEASELAFQKSRQYWFDVIRVRGVLGDAYDRAGRSTEARRALKSSLDGQVANRAPDNADVLAIRERWGRFLLTQGDRDGAAEQFRHVLALAHERPLVHVALAYGGLARVALAAHDRAAALTASREATARFDRASGGIIDMRSGPYLWLIHAAVLGESGDHLGAREWAQKALDASRRYDDPSSPAIAEAEAEVRAAGQ